MWGAITQHNRRLTSTVEALLTPDTRALLDTLLRQESADEAAAGSNAAYKLTLMKKLSQSTKPAKVKERVADLQLSKPAIDCSNLYWIISPSAKTAFNTMPMASSKPRSFS